MASAPLKGKGKGVCKLFMEIHLTTTECHLPYGITQCYLPPDTSEHTPPLPQPDSCAMELSINTYTLPLPFTFSGTGKQL